MSGQESRWQLIVDSQDAISNITKLRNAFQSSFANLPGIKEMQAQLDTAKQKLVQLGASVTNLDKLKAGATGAATETTKLSTEMTKLGTTSKTAGTSLTTVATETTKVTKGLKETEDQTKKTGSKFSDVFGKSGVMALGVSTAAQGILGLSRTYRDFGDVQIAVDKAQRKVGLANEAVAKAQAKLNELTKAGITSGADWEQANLDAAQAVEKQGLAVTDLGERQEDAGDKQQDMILGVIQTVTGLGTTFGTMATAVTGHGEKIKGVLGKIGGGMAGLASKGKGLIAAVPFLFNPATAIVVGGLLLAGKLLEQDTKLMDAFAASGIHLTSTQKDSNKAFAEANAISRVTGMNLADIATKPEEVAKAYIAMNGPVSESGEIVTTAADQWDSATPPIIQLGNALFGIKKQAEPAVKVTGDLAAAQDRYDAALVQVQKEGANWNSTVSEGTLAEFAAAKSALAAEQAKVNLAKSTKDATVATTEHAEAVDKDSLAANEGATVIQSGNDIYVEQGGIIRKVTKDSELYAVATGKATKSVSTANPILQTNSQLMNASALGMSKAEFNAKTFEEKMEILKTTIGSFKGPMNTFTDALGSGIKRFQDLEQTTQDGVVAEGQYRKALIAHIKDAKTVANADKLTTAQLEEKYKAEQGDLSAIKSLDDAENKHISTLDAERVKLEAVAQQYLTQSTVMNASKADLTAFDATIGKSIEELKAKRDALQQSVTAEKLADKATLETIQGFEKEIIAMTNLNKIYDGSTESLLDLSKARIAGVEAAQDLVTQSALTAESNKTELASLQKIVDGYKLKLPGSIYTSIESLRAIIKAQGETGEGALALGKILDQQLAPAFQQFNNLLHETDFKQFKEGFKGLELDKVFGKSGAKGLRDVFDTLREGTVDVDNVSTAFHALQIATAKGGLGGEAFSQDAKKLSDAMRELGNLDPDASTKPMQEFYDAISTFTPEQLNQHAGSIEKFFTAMNSETGMTPEKAKDIKDTFSKENTGNIGAMATNAETLGTNLATIQAPDLTPFTSGLTDAANAAKLTASGVSLLKFDFPAPDLSQFAQALNDSKSAAQQTANDISKMVAVLNANPKPAKDAMTETQSWWKKIGGNIQGLVPMLKANNKSALDVMKSTQVNWKGYANKISKIIPKITVDNKDALSKIQKVIDTMAKVKDKTVTIKVNTVAAAGGGVFPDTSIIRAARGGVFTTNGPHNMLVGDNPGGRETVAAIPHNNPGPTLMKIMSEFGAKVTNLNTVSGGGGGNNGALVVNLYNINNDRETIRTFKAQMGRDTYKFGG